MEVQELFQGSFELFPSLENILHICGQVIEGLNSRVVRSPLVTWQ
jgi:hypothetical protein